MILYYSDSRISPADEAELKRENRITSINRNDPITFNNDDSNYNRRVNNHRQTYDEEDSNEPVSLKLRPKPKYENYKSVTFFAWQLFQVRIRFIFTKNLFI